MDTSEVERELEELETRIERLRALYEQYFMGIERLEPQIPRKDVDRRIWLMRREQIRNTGLRFKFQMLFQRYNTFQQYWGRTTREIENGTYRRDVLRAANRFGQKDALTVVGKKRAERYKLLADKQDADKERQRAAAEPGEPAEVNGERASRSALSPDLMRRIEELDQAGWNEAAWAGDAHAEAEAGRTVPAAMDAERAIAGAPPAAQPRDNVAEAKQRVAVLAAQMKAQRGAAPAAIAHAGEPLDLDLDLDAPSSRKSTPPARRRSTMPPKRKSSGRMKAVKIPPPPPVPAERPPVPAPALEAPRRPGRSVRPPAPPVAAPPPPRVQGALPPPVPPPRPLAAPPAPPPAAPPARPVAVAARPAPVKEEGELGEQRLRQIYAKYVETKRASNESTAGLTYEKLAASLRAQADKLRATHTTKKVDYDVIVRDGKTILKPILR